MLKLNKRVREITYKYSSLSGQISSKKLNKSVQFESALKRDFIYLLEFNLDVKAYLEQNNKLRKYTPDFIVSYHDTFRKNEVIEIKYQEELDKEDEDLKVKLEAARLYCIKNDLMFRVCTDEYIYIKNKTRLRNFKFLARYRDCFDGIDFKKTGVEIDAKDSLLLLKKLRTEKKKDHTIIELIDLITNNKTQKAQLIFLTWHMIANNFILYDKDSWLNLDSKIWAH
ncbi:hypothetical protein FHS04_002834 [Mesoflavibacter sabulilitoris]|uniref:TnsA endonuclease N-terminal domain-containing protein n=1 Tax=Mesoflavibacter zeaxanthinifaciens subsp. sabulilitoris TaxID=1520893 RepID=A0A2T1NNR3_9FLAO|nr:TnsA endonuclease N-terminal domain-containing protein [Mesoflavibacter zeaxanthinifaciens]MBB3125290.1 hypothetical protein [Mesoflavibacter zeaxanthinifaciens subsp. sabulilitoris]PSG94525.1 hypothetical protein C7H61_00900 [Mesoflavibacter zeaxanthinifaciens subsp. sabulilitoris]